MSVGEAAPETRKTTGTRHRGWRIAATVVGSIFGALVVALIGYSVATTPASLPGRAPLYAFNPELVGRMEQEAWAAYYYRQWPRLFDLLLRLSRNQFGLSLPQALYASYVGTQAQVVFARQGDADGTAEAYMRDFYAYVKAPTGGQYDPARAAHLEIGWWVVHRHRDEYPDRSALTAALAASYAEVYQVPAERMMAAAEDRAEAMDLSDRWQREGKQEDSPLLGQIADLLVRSYRSLSEAVAPSA
jgi:hypothetical protein